MLREAINELKKYTLGKKNTEKVEINVLQLNRVIKALEQEPKIGHWERETFDLGNDLPIRVAYQCSECGEYFDVEFKYCPNCGAKMVEPQESEDKE